MWLLDPQYPVSGSVIGQQEAEPVGAASKSKGFAVLLRHRRQGMLSSVLMAFIWSGGLKAASRCAYLLPHTFKREIETHLRGQFFRKFFLTIFSAPGGGLSVVLLGISLT